MQPKLDDYNIESSSEEFLAVFKQELKQFEKPRCDLTNDGTRVEDILKDIHRAIYGNGSTRGLIWKIAEQTVFLIEAKDKQTKCRAQVVAHFQEHDKEEIKKNQGMFAFVGRRKKLSIVVVLLVFFGVSSLWGIFLQQRQTTKLEQLVIKAVKTYVKL